MNKKTGIIIFILILIILIGFFVYLYTLDKKPTEIVNETQISTNPKKTDMEKPEINYSGTIVYTRNDNGNTEILSKKYNDEEHIIYTDKDDELKIKSVKSITNDGLVLVKIGNIDNELNNSLYLINIENSEKTKLIDNFSSISEPVISPDGRNIAYTLFFNNEKNYGYNLYTMNTNGQNKVKIANYPDSIENITWNNNSNSIIYSVNNELIETNLNNLDKKIITKFDTNDKIKSIFVNNNYLLLNINSNGKSKLQTINLNDNKITDLNINANLYNDVIWVNSQNDQIALIDENNLIYLYSPKGNIKISNANNLLKWFK